MRERFEKMPEDKRQRAMEKFRKWQEMSGDEQAHFRFMQGEREKRARQAVEDTVRNSGLTLDEGQKQQFTEIYKRERRKLEEELRAEMDRRRQERLPELQKLVIEAYRKEAVPIPSTPLPTPTPMVAPSATATP